MSGSHQRSVRLRSDETGPIQTRSQPLGKRRRMRDPGTRAGINMSNDPELDTHEKLTCGECFLTTKQKGDLTRHVNEVHGGQRNYQCDNCKATFTRNTSLSGHWNNSKVGKACHLRLAELERMKRILALPSAPPTAESRSAELSVEANSDPAPLTPDDPLLSLSELEAWNLVVDLPRFQDLVQAKAEEAAKMIIESLFERRLEASLQDMFDRVEERFDELAQEYREELRNARVQGKFPAEKERSVTPNPGSSAVRPKVGLATPEPTVFVPEVDADADAQLDSCDTHGENLPHRFSLFESEFYSPAPDHREAVHGEARAENEISDAEVNHTPNDFSDMINFSEAGSEHETNEWMTKQSQGGNVNELSLNQQPRHNPPSLPAEYNDLSLQTFRQNLGLIERNVVEEQDAYRKVTDSIRPYRDTPRIHIQGSCGSSSTTQSKGSAAARRGNEGNRATAGQIWNLRIRGGQSVSSSKGKGKAIE